jgi:hypothetical protein
MAQIGDVAVATRGGVPVGVKKAYKKRWRKGRGGYHWHRADADWGNSRSVSAMVDAKMK